MPHSIKDGIGFVDFRDLASIAMRMIQTSRREVFPPVYRLQELILFLPVTIASIERSFSTMNLIEIDLRSLMGGGMDECYDDMLHGKGYFYYIEDENILQHFQNMLTHRNQLHAM